MSDEEKAALLCQMCGFLTKIQARRILAIFEAVEQIKDIELEELQGIAGNPEMEFGNV
jgi:hypothetical protein